MQHIPQGIRIGFPLPHRFPLTALCKEEGENGKRQQEYEDCSFHLAGV